MLCVRACAVSIFCTYRSALTKMNLYDSVKKPPEYVKWYSDADLAAMSISSLDWRHGMGVCWDKSTITMHYRWVDTRSVKGWRLWGERQHVRWWLADLQPDVPKHLALTPPSPLWQIGLDSPGRAELTNTSNRLFTCFTSLISINILRSITSLT